MKKEILVAAIAFFASAAHAGVDTVYVTTDAQVFKRDQDAFAHQRDLTNKADQVVKVNRADVATGKTAPADDVVIDATNVADAKLEQMKKYAKASGCPEEEYIKIASKKEMLEYLEARNLVTKAPDAQ